MDKQKSSLLPERIEEEIEAKKAREHSLANLRQYSDSDVVNLPHRSNNGRTRDIIAERIKLSGSSYERAKKVVTRADALRAQGFADEAYGLLYVLNQQSIDAAMRCVRETNEDVRNRALRSIAQHGQSLEQAEQEVLQAIRQEQEQARKATEERRRADEQARRAKEAQERAARKADEQAQRAKEAQERARQNEQARQEAARLAREAREAEERYWKEQEAAEQAAREAHFRIFFLS